MSSTWLSSTGMAGVVIDRTSFDRPTFMDATMLMRKLCEEWESGFLYSEGVYLFDQIPGDSETITLIDTNYGTATSINRYGDAYEIQAINRRKDDVSGKEYVQFDIGRYVYLVSEHQSLIRNAQPYLKSGFRLRDDLDGLIGTMITERVPGLPPLIEADEAPSIYRETREARAAKALAYFYPYHKQGVIEDVVSAIEYRTNKYMLQWEVPTRYAIRSMYDIHCDAMTEISNVMTSSDHVTLSSSGPRSVYATYEGRDTYTNERIVDPFGFALGLGHSDVASAILTPLPWLIVVRQSKVWWEVNTKKEVVKDAMPKTMVDTRKFCDVHTPLFWRGGLDTYLWGDITAGLYTPIAGVMKDPGKYQVYFNKTMDWLNGDSWGDFGWTPGDYLNSSISNRYSTGSSRPWIMGPGRNYGSGKRRWNQCEPLGMKYRTMLTGVPSTSLAQSRNGMNNDAVRKEVRKYLENIATGYQTRYLNTYPADHALGMFYRFITRTELSDVKSILER